jgi:hypothetical protein
MVLDTSYNSCKLDKIFDKIADSDNMNNSDGDGDYINYNDICAELKCEKCNYTCVGRIYLDS